MAYGDTNEAFELPLRTLRRTADFSGRSRRTEVVYYWIAAWAVSLLLGFAVSVLSPFQSIYAAECVRGLLAIPLFALLVRRLRDQDRPAWLALILPAAIILALPDMVRWASWDAARLITYEERGPHPLQWLQAAAQLATFVLFLLPGTEGLNRYGEDPRQTD